MSGGAPDGTAPARRRIARPVRLALLALPLLAASGCVAAGPRAGLAASAPVFSPERFFAGATEGTGTLKVIAHRRRAVHVLGAGQVAPDGTITLSQQVTDGDEPPRTRRWSIRQVAPGRYAGTLSDAAGPITGEVTGNLLHLRFRMTGGLAAEQRLYLQPDGRTVLNRLTVRKLGVVVAVLDETIRKIG